ncbi:hypothetical protein [Xanthomonas arboricola]|uniref:hypothetical protein n=1 Tax=Xanthomonas arboricola TaxID=56448 RepID=UPI0011B0EFE0|nr:hypothetical protein [Xanthomonas arboricola]
MATIKKIAVLNAVEIAVQNVITKIAIAKLATNTGLITASAYKATAARAQGKAYELRILLEILKKMHGYGYLLSCSVPSSGVLTFGGSPCRPNLPQHNWVSAKKGSDELQIWVSVQFRTLSHQLRTPSTQVKEADRHEIDVGVYRVLKGQSYPGLSQIVFAASCKSGGWNKAYVREALGLRRELGYFTKPQTALAQWYIKEVCSSPAIPLVLYSDNLLCNSYQSLESLGLFVEHFP